MEYSSDGKESAFKAGDTGLIPGSEASPGEGNSHSHRKLAGCSPWGHKELDMTEHTYAQAHIVDL